MKKHFITPRTGITKLELIEIVQAAVCSETEQKEQCEDIKCVDCKFNMEASGNEDEFLKWMCDTLEIPEKGFIIDVNMVPDNISAEEFLKAYRENDSVDNVKWTFSEKKSEASPIKESMLEKFKTAPSHWPFVKLTEEWLDNNGFTYNDLNGDSRHWQIKTPKGVFQILSGEDGFCYDYKIGIETVFDLTEIYKKEIGECLPIIKY